MVLCDLALQLIPPAIPPVLVVEARPPLVEVPVVVAIVVAGASVAVAGEVDPAEVVAPMVAPMVAGTLKMPLPRRMNENGEMPRRSIRNSNNSSKQSNSSDPKAIRPAIIKMHSLTASRKIQMQVRSTN